MTLKWKEVIAKDEYQRLNPEEKAEAQNQYFNDVVAPQAGDDVDEARAQFFAQYPAATTPSNPPQETSVAEELLLGLQESARAAITAAASIADIIPEVGDAFVGAAVWAAHQVGVGDGTYTPAARFKGYLPEELKPKTGAGKVVAEIIPFFVSPGAKAAEVPKVAGKMVSLGERILARIGKSGADNVVGSLAYADKPGEDFGTTLIENMLLGEVFRNAGKLLGLGYRAMKGTPDAANKGLVELAEQHGVRLMTSDVFQPKTQMGKALRMYQEQIPFVGTGGAREAQQASRQKLVERLGGENLAPTETEVLASLIRQRDKIKAAAGKRYDAINGSMGHAAIDVSQSIRAIKDAIASLERPGLARDEQTINALKGFLDDIDAAPQDFGLWKQNRTAFRERIQGDRPVLPNNADRVVSSVYRRMTDDLYSSVSQRLGSDTARKYQQADAIYADEASKIKGTRLKNLFQKGGLLPEAATAEFFSQSPGAARVLYNSLDNRGKDALRREMISRAVNATRTVDASGNSVVNPSRFSAEMKKMSTQFNLAFRGRDAEEMMGIRQLLNATRQAQDAALNPQTGARLIPATIWGGLGVGAGTLGIVPTLAIAVGSGAAARGYESKLVRDALIRLAGTEAGSTGFEKALKKVVDAISASAKGALQYEEPRITITKGYNT